MPDLYMFRFDMEQFADTCSRSSHTPHDEIPLIVTISLEPSFEKFIIGIADYVFQKVLLLYFHELYLQFLLFRKFKKLVDTLQPKVHRLWLEVLHQIPLICQEVLFVYFPIMTEEILHRPHIRGDSVFGKISLCQMISEFCYHTTLI